MESKEKETIISEKFDYVLKKIKEMGASPIMLLESLCIDKQDKAYKVLTENPNITREEYLEIMEIEEM